MNTFLEEAEKARTQSQFKRAQEIYSRLLWKKGLDTEEKIEAYLGLADVERIQGLFPQALTHYQQAARLFKGRHGKSCWDAQVGWALAARACGRPKEALVILHKALAVYQKEKDLEGQAFAHWALGGTLRISGNMKGGLKELLTALEMFKSLKNSEGVAYTCCALGGIYRMLGRYSDSGKYYREANRRMRQRKDTFGIAYSYCGLGNVERMGHRFQQALPFYRKAEKLYGAIGDRVSYAYTLWSLGTTHKMMQLSSKATTYFLKADKLFEQTGDTRGRIYVSIGLSELTAMFSVKSKLRKTIETYIRKKKLNKIPITEFPWEGLHEFSMLYLLLIQAGETLAKMSKTPKSRALEKASLEAIGDLRNKYRKKGSRFYPKSIPVNWP